MGKPFVECEQENCADLGFFLAIRSLFEYIIKKFPVRKVPQSCRGLAHVKEVPQ